MTTLSPIVNHLSASEPDLMPWGNGDAAPLVISTFGELEFEYAALRRSCVLIDQPHRHVIEVKGTDAVSFLDRMLTQKLSDLMPGQSRASFWLNRKGRLVADLRVLATEAGVLLDVDAATSTELMNTLGAFVFAEDLELVASQDQWHRIAAHGPDAEKLMQAASGASDALLPGQVRTVEIDRVAVVVERLDTTGEPGIEFFVPESESVRVWVALASAAEAHSIRLRPAGWHAYNIARIESGVPMFHLDFSGESLPAETGVEDSRVSFAKGCYLGQEIVARMHNLGNPKQRLVGLRLNAPDDSESWQPVTGTPLYASSDEGQVGVVTSSTPSPMLGGEPICFAMVRWAQSNPSTVLTMRDGAHEHACTVQASLRFWPRRSQA